MHLRNPSVISQFSKTLSFTFLAVVKRPENIVSEKITTNKLNLKMNFESWSFHYRCYVVRTGLALRNFNTSNSN